MLLKRAVSAFLTTKVALDTVVCKAGGHTLTQLWAGLGCVINWIMEVSCMRIVICLGSCSHARTGTSG